MENIKWTTQMEQVKQALLTMQRHPWEQGLAMQAVWELGDETTALRLATEAAYRIHHDGRVAAIGGMEAQTDPSACGEVLLWAAEKTGNPVFKAAIEGLLTYDLEKAGRSKDGIVYHMTYDKSFWVDSMHMLPPFLALAGHVDEAIKQMNGYWQALFLPEKGLLAHRYDDEHQNFQRDAVWATGNAWALSGIARVIDALPFDYEMQKQELIHKANQLIHQMRGHLGEEKLFYDVLDDPESYLDGASTLLYTYSIYRGLKSGWLTDPTLKPQADQMFEAAISYIDELGFIRQVAGAPDFMTVGISPEAQSFCLMAYAAKGRLEAYTEAKANEDNRKNNKRAIKKAS